MSVTPAVAIIAVLVLLLALVVLPLSRTALIAVSVVLVTLSSTYLDRDGGGSAAVSAGVRVAAFVVLLRLRWPVRGEPSVVHTLRPSVRSVAWFAPLLLAGMAIYLVAATLPHQEVGTFLLYGQGALLAVAYAWVIRRYARGPEVLTGVLFGLLAVVACSLLMLLAAPHLAMLGGRLRGLTSNPNIFGFYCAIALTVVVLTKRHVLLVTVAGAMSLGALALTASRASLLIVVIAGIGWLALRRSTASRFMALAVAVVVGILLVQYPALLSGDAMAIFRTHNSRQGSLEYTLAVLESHERLGIGLGNEIVQVASTPLRALVHAGYLGGIAVTVMYLVVLFCSWRAGRPTLLFGLAMVVHSLFEGWFLSPVGPMFLVFLAVWHGLANSEEREPAADAVSEPVLVRGALT
jgi:hypothetical protein